MVDGSSLSSACRVPMKASQSEGSLLSACWSLVESSLVRLPLFSGNIGGAYRSGVPHGWTVGCSEHRMSFVQWVSLGEISSSGPGDVRWSLVTEALVVESGPVVWPESAHGQVVNEAGGCVS
jgi:hypothetical protein